MTLPFPFLPLDKDATSMPSSQSIPLVNQLPRTEFRGTTSVDRRHIHTTNFVVAIDQPDWINQFNMLPLCWCDESLMITIHHSPKWTMEGGVPTFNFDILITTDQKKWEGIVPPEALFVTPRLGKTKQNILLNRFLNAHNTYHAMTVQVWGSNFDNKHASYLGYDIDGKVVVKPEDGARGVCHMVVDFDKVSVGAFVRDLFTKSVTLQQMHEKYKEHLTIGEGHAWDDKEAQKTKEEGEFTFQRYVEDIAAEYRILTDHNGDIGFACKRDRSGDQYKQATGVTHYTDNIVPTTQEDLIAIIQEDWGVFVKLLKVVVGPMQSVDLFVTKDGKWGICEYCNQYGIVGVPREYYLSSVKHYVVDCIEKYLHR